MCRLGLVKAGWLSTGLYQNHVATSFCTEEKNSIFNALLVFGIAMFPFLDFRVKWWVTQERRMNGYQEEKIKGLGPPRFVCWILYKPYNRVTPEWLVSKDGPARRHLSKNEAISEAHQLWLTPNRPCTRSKTLFALKSFAVWTKSCK